MLAVACPYADTMHSEKPKVTTVGLGYRVHIALLEGM